MSYAEYLQYIVNTGCVPLKASQFDEDWEPIGPILRKDMLEAGLIVEQPDGLRITDKGRGCLP